MKSQSYWVALLLLCGLMIACSSSEMQRNIQTNPIEVENKPIIEYEVSNTDTLPTPVENNTGSNISGKSEESNAQSKPESPEQILENVRAYTDKHLKQLEKPNKWVLFKSIQETYQGVESHNEIWMLGDQSGYVDKAIYIRSDQNGNLLSYSIQNDGVSYLVTDFQNGMPVEYAVQPPFEENLLIKTSPIYWAAAPIEDNLTNPNAVISAEKEENLYRVMIEYTDDDPGYADNFGIDELITGGKSVYLFDNGHKDLIEDIEYLILESGTEIPVLRNQYETAQLNKKLPPNIQQLWDQAIPITEAMQIELDGSIE